MKKIQILGFGILFLFFSSGTINAQEWNQDRAGIYSIGIGGTNVINVGPGFAGVSGAGMSLNFSGEYKVQRFVGLGFETGMDVFFHPYYFPGPPYPTPYYTSIGIPIGMKINVHILDAANAPIANKLDVYAGLNFGGGPAFYTSPGGGVYGFIQAGPQIGIRYWPSRNIGVFAEFGWGATFGNVGLTF